MSRLKYSEVQVTACRYRVAAAPEVIADFGPTTTPLTGYSLPSLSHATPVLFCYALINRSYILDLQPDKSVVGRYLERGFDVYMIDWQPPADADRPTIIGQNACGRAEVHA